MKNYKMLKFWLLIMITPIIISIAVLNILRNGLDSNEAGTVHNGINLKIVNNEIILNDSISLYRFIAVSGGNYNFKYKDTYLGDSDYYSKHVSSMLIGETEIPRSLYFLVMDWQNAFSYYYSMYKNFSKNFPFTFEDAIKFDDGPIVCTLEEWQVFLNQLSLITGRKFIIPDIYEWYYAAQGGNSSKKYKYAGSDSIDDVCWYIKNTPLDAKNPEWLRVFSMYKFGTRKKKPNELGLYGMSGGVKEIVLYSRNPNNIKFNRTTVKNINYVGGDCNSNENECRIDLLNLSSFYANPELKGGLRPILQY